MARSPNCVHIGNRPLGKDRDICAFFHTKEEEHRTLVDFIKEGIEQNERAAHFVCGDGVEDHRNRLLASGVDVEGAEKRGQLTVATWDDAYLKDGHLDQDRQIKLLEGVLQAGRNQGDVLAAICSDPGLHTLRVFILTSSSEDEDRSHADELEAQEYFDKSNNERLWTYDNGARTIASPINEYSGRQQEAS